MQQRKCKSLETVKPLVICNTFGFRDISIVCNACYVSCISDFVLFANAFANINVDYVKQSEVIK